MSLEFISNEHMLFPTPLWQVQIKGVDNDAIKKYVYHLRDTTEGVVISNRGGWHSKDILEPIPEALENLFSNFQSFVNQYCAQITGLNQLKIGNFWFNINSKYDYNRTHDHQNSILSAVYYIDARGDNIGSFVAERDDSAHIDYLKRDVLWDDKHGHSDIDMTADEKHISKLAGDIKYDKKHH